MPYKTKAAKIAAAQRRYDYIEAKGDGTFSYKDKPENKPQNAQIRSQDSISDKLYIKKDLIRIAIASIIIITVQAWLSLTLF